MKDLHRRPVDIGSPFAVACSPVPGREEEIVGALKSAGIRRTLVRVPSWERDRLGRHSDFAALLRREGLDVVVALLQRRDDVLDPAGWQGFLADAFSALAPSASHFEVGHAWNRTKWGVWDWREYVALAAPALELAAVHGVRVVGPAVIDFEFHLYPPVLRRLAFDKVSSLLYVDRTGAPESAQFGWTMAKKLALWRAVVDRVAPRAPRLLDHGIQLAARGHGPVLAGARKAQRHRGGAGELPRAVFRDRRVERARREDVLVAARRSGLWPHR